MPLVPFINNKPATPMAAYWDGCEVVTGKDKIVRVIGPHGSVEYSPGTELRSHNLPAHWPRPVEPAEWEETVSASSRVKWRARATEMETEGPLPPRG